jgi:ubiquinol-cytochrome c reductase iron-sulfur subunit
MNRRRVLEAAAALVGSFAAYFASIPFVRSMLPSARAHAFGNPIEIDLSGMAPGEVKPYIYRGRTILVLRRTPDMLRELDSMSDRMIDVDSTDDPDYASNEGRSILPEFLVVEGVCTHLGCVPRLTSAEQGKRAVGKWWTGGFICPCHISGYDYAGRVVRGPAPKNLPVPPYRYISASKIIVGEETERT